LEQFLAAAYKIDPGNRELVQYYSHYYQEGFLNLMTEDKVSFDSLFLGLKEFHQILDLGHTQPDVYLRFLDGCQVSETGEPAETQIKDALKTLAEIHRQMPVISVYSLVDNLPVFFQHGFSQSQIGKTLETAARLTPAESHYFLPDQIASLLQAGVRVESLAKHLTLINKLAEASGESHQNIASAVDYSLKNYALPAKKLPELLRRAAVISRDYHQRGDGAETTSLAFELLAYQTSHGYSPRSVGVNEIRAFEEFMPSQSSMPHPILEILTPAGASISGAVSPEDLFGKISVAYNQDTEGARVMDSEKIGAFLSQMHEWSINSRANDEARTNFVNKLTPASAYRLLSDVSPGVALEIIPAHHSLYTSSVELLLGRLDRLETKDLASVFESDPQLLPGFAVTTGHFGQLGKFVGLFPETFLPPIRNAIENSSNPLLTLLDLEGGIAAGLESQTSTDYQNLVVNLHRHYLQTERWSDAAATAFLLHAQSEIFLEGPQGNFVAQELRRWPAPDFDPELPEWRNSPSYNIVLKYIEEDEDVPGAVDYFPGQGYQLTQVDARNWQAVKQFPNGKTVNVYITFDRFTEAAEGPIHFFAGLGHSYRYSEMFTPPDQDHDMSQAIIYNGGCGGNEISLSVQYNSPHVLYWAHTAHGYVNLVTINAMIEGIVNGASTWHDLETPGMQKWDIITPSSPRNVMYHYATRPDLPKTTSPESTAGGS
jgi:hypothetical protein